MFFSFIAYFMLKTFKLLNETQSQVADIAVIIALLSWQ